MADRDALTYEEMFGAPPPKSDPAAMSYDEMSRGTANPGPLTKSPDDGMLAGATKGAATGVIKGLAHIPGFAGDVTALGDVASGYLLGKKPEELRQQRAKMGYLPSWMSPDVMPTGAEIAAPILKKTGEYQPESTAGKMGQAAIEGAVSALGPGSGALRGAKPAAATIESIKQAPFNALSGAAAEGAYDLTKDPRYAFAAGMLAPGAASVGAKLAGKATRPMFSSQHEAIAGEQLEGMMSDPTAVRDALWPARGPTQPFVLAGSQPTLGQLTGDIGLLQGEREAIRKDNSAFNINEANRNTTRLKALEGIPAPGADTAKLSETIRGYNDHLTNTLDAEEARLTQEAQRHVDRLGPAAQPEVIGSQLRSAVETARAKAKAGVRELYNLIDPDGKLSIVASPVREGAASIAGSVDPLAAPLTADAERVFNTAQSIPDVVPFKSLIEFDQNITDALRAERRANGESNSWRLLSQLKGHTQKAIDEAIENQHAYEQQAVARGHMTPEDTTRAKILGWIEDWQKSRGLDSPADHGAGAVSAWEPPVVSGDAGANISGARDNRGAQTGARGSVEPNFNDAAAGRLSAAKQAHRDYSTTYKTEPVAGSIKTTGFSGQYQAPSSAIPGRAFVPGDKGYETASAFLTASEKAPEAVSAMQEAALNALRKTAVKDGAIQPERLAKWKADHAGALRAIDEQIPGFSSSFDNAGKATERLTDFAAQAKQARDDFQKSAFGKFVGVTEPGDIENVVGRMLTAKTGAVSNIRQMVKTMPPEAVEGLRKAAADWISRTMLNATEAGTTGQKSLGNAKMQNLLRNHGPVLAELFTPEQMNTLRAITRDLELSNRSVQATAIKGSPGTAKDVTSSLLKMSGQVKDTTLAVAMFEALREAYEAGGVKGAMTLGVPMMAGSAFSHLRGKGAEKVQNLVTEALFDPVLARQLLMKVPKKSVPHRLEMLSRSTRGALLSQMQNEDVTSRPGRAAGGRTGPKAQTAQSLINAVKRAKKAIQQQTETILSQPDESVVKALAVANKHI